MNDVLMKDMSVFPKLFWLTNPVSKAAAHDLQTRFGPPDDLLAFWCEFGSGTLFETEEILDPLNLLSSTTYHTKQGYLPDRSHVFHVGTFLSTFDQEFFYVLHPDTLVEQASFATLDSWYVGTVRSEFYQRYGLPKLK